MASFKAGKHSGMNLRIRREFIAKVTAEIDRLTSSGLKLYEVAERSGISQPETCLMAAGKFDKMSLDKIIWSAERLGYSSVEVDIRHSREGL